MAVTAAMVKEIRELTGAGMVDCKNALTETDGDMQLAVNLLREKGLAAAAKKSGRIAAEGLVDIIVEGKKAVIVEVNCETDFVAKNGDFKDYVALVAKQAIKSNAANLEEFYAEKWDADNSVTVKEAVSQKIAIIGENINIRRYEVLTAGSNGFFASYIHGGGKAGVVLELEGVENETTLEAGRNICMQIAALFPKYVTRADIPEEFVASEKEILIAQAENDEKLAGKPANVVEKIIEGKLTKQLKEICLLEQGYVKDNELTVAQYIQSIGKEVGTPLVAKRFVNYERGEGIEKKVEDFAAEVNKVING